MVDGRQMEVEVSIQLPVDMENHCHFSLETDYYIHLKYTFLY